MAALFQSSASAQTKIPLSGSDMRSQADIDEYINTYYDELQEATKGKINGEQLAGYFNEATQKNDTFIIKRKVKGNNVASMNEDGEAIPMIRWGQGWGQTRRVYPYRVGVQHQRRLEEVDDYGQIAQEAEELMDSGYRTIHYARADVFNRGIDDGVMATGAPVLALDGMYMIDSARPNPVAGVPAWSNLESQASLSEGTLFTAELNAQNTLAPNGDPLPMSIMGAVIPSTYEQQAWKVNNTPGTLGTAQNDLNWAKGRFNYETCQDFTGNTVFYKLASPKSKSNELLFIWSVRFGVLPMNPEDPDVIAKRLRFIFGLSLGDPRAMWRGGYLNAL
jgi:hypothetical protein